VSDQEGEFDPLLAAQAEDIIQQSEVQDDFTYAGHSFGLRTLSVAEEIAAAKVIESFRNTLKEPEAWATAKVALALTHVDDDPDFCPPLGKSNKTAHAKARLNYVGEWAWPIIDALFQFYTRLEAQRLKKIQEAQDLSEGSLLISWPLVDSFEASGISSDEMSTESPETVS
jgi:hypothetical protein